MINSNPHLPDSEACLFLLDRRAEKVKLNNIVQSYEHNNLLAGINTHPDMTFCPLEKNKAVVAKEAYEYYNEMLLKYGYEIMKGENTLKKEYPYDIAYNCVILGGKLFHKIEYTDKAILDYCKENNIELINVTQGYTKCSTLIVDEKSVITCDKKLNEVYLKNGIASICVDNKCIRINNFDHGFIGGCGGKISKNKIAFFGNIKEHPDYQRINEFLRERNVSHLSLTDGQLFDYGSLIPLHIRYLRVF